MYQSVNSNGNLEAELMVQTKTFKKSETLLHSLIDWKTFIYFFSAYVFQEVRNNIAKYMQYLFY